MCVGLTPSVSGAGEAQAYVLFCSLEHTCLHLPLLPAHSMWLLLPPSRIKHPSSTLTSLCAVRKSSIERLLNSNLNVLNPDDFCWCHHCFTYTLFSPLHCVWWIGLKFTATLMLRWDRLNIQWMYCYHNVNTHGARYQDVNYNYVILLQVWVCETVCIIVCFQLAGTALEHFKPGQSNLNKMCEHVIFHI